MAWDFFAHTRTLELLYHKMQAPVLEEYHLTQIELDVLLFLSHHPQQDTAKDIVEIPRLRRGGGAGSAAVSPAAAPPGQ